VGGNFHPLLKVRAEFRRILMEMGFEEMPTSKWVESSFWNFDALFQPQVESAYVFLSPGAKSGLLTLFI
jgi:phenylalanyl-tRNA synthetase alpha chain